MKERYTQNIEHSTNGATRYRGYKNGADKAHKLLNIRERA